MCCSYDIPTTLSQFLGTLRANLMLLACQNSHFCIMWGRRISQSSSQGEGTLCSNLSTSIDLLGSAPTQSLTQNQGDLCQTEAQEGGIGSRDNLWHHPLSLLGSNVLPSPSQFCPCLPLPRNASTLPSARGASLPSSTSLLLATLYGT